MIKVFSSTDTQFSTNGDIILQPLRAVVHKEDNGPFYLELECDLSYLDFIVEGRLLVADTPQGAQPFRITNVTKTRSKIKAKVNHVFYDSQNYLIADSYVVDKDCNGALAHLNLATQPQSEFSTISDVTTISSYRCVRTSLYEAIQVVLERWGGHLVRDGFEIGIRESVGADNGVTIRYAKNLKDITCSTSWESVVTKILPVGKDGLLLPDNDGYLVSETQYDVPFTKSVSFDQSEIIEDDFRDVDGELDEEAYMEALITDLRQQGQAYLDANCVPMVNYSLSANLEKITDIGDTVEVIDERLGINLRTNVISYEYDCILGRYINVQFGNFQKTLSNLVGSINAATETMVNEKTEAARVTLSSELAEATGKIWAVLGNSYVRYYGDKILVLDNEDEQAATNVMVINSGGIGFSTQGVAGPFNSAWTIDGTMDMQKINVINLTANMIRGGTLKLGSELNQNGVLELYDAANNLIGEMTHDGLKMYGQDRSYVKINNEVGFAGYDRNDNKLYWVDGEEFHMKKSVIEEEITLCSKMRFIPIEIYSGTTLVNDGIGLVSVSS